MHCRRKMNRESARRTRQRKQEQTVSLKAEVCACEINRACAVTQFRTAIEHDVKYCAQ